MLTVTLRNLERIGMVTRTIYAEVPPRVEYRITARGRSYVYQLNGLIDWACNISKDLMVEWAPASPNVIPNDSPDACKFLPSLS
jgi:DNA-binding HxlR family transcriptional regulator